MDIAGAKALKKRLDLNGAPEPPPSSADVHEDAPPVFHWLGISQPAPEDPAAGPDDDPATQGASLFQRLGLGFR
jgi:hypothetical protein